jgi:hypothetical protein
MKSRVGLVTPGLVLLLAVAGCGSAPQPRSGGRWVPDVSYWGLSPQEVTQTEAIWKHEVRRQGVKHLDAVVSLHGKGGPGVVSESGRCPRGSLLRIVIRGTFPTKSSAITYEDLYSASNGRICHVTYRKVAPNLTGEPQHHLHRIYDVSNSG